MQTGALNPNDSTKYFFKHLIFYLYKKTFSWKEKIKKNKKVEDETDGERKKQKRWKRGRTQRNNDGLEWKKQKTNNFKKIKEQWKKQDEGV